jgi:hypothetical protein
VLSKTDYQYCILKAESESEGLRHQLEIAVSEADNKAARLEQKVKVELGVLKMQAYLQKRKQKNVNTCCFFGLGHVSKATCLRIPNSRSILYFISRGKLQWRTRPPGVNFVPLFATVGVVTPVGLPGEYLRTWQDSISLVALRPVLKTVELRRSSKFERSLSKASSFVNDEKNVSMTKRTSLGRT